MDIKRSRSSASGGLTDKEHAALIAHNRLWEERANRTTPIKSEEIVPAINSLYCAAGFEEPRVVIVSSPGAMAFAGTFASAIWSKREDSPDYLYRIDRFRGSASSSSYQKIAYEALRAIEAATTMKGRNDSTSKNHHRDVLHSTEVATYGKADLATATAIDRATGDDIRNGAGMQLLTLYHRTKAAMCDDFGNSVMTEMMTKATEDWAQGLAVDLFNHQEEANAVVQSACDWWKYCQTGSTGAYWDYCITAARDVLGLDLPEFRDYKPWEDCAVHGGYRYMHPEFCLVSDAPSEFTRDDNPNTARGINVVTPAYRWRDGWAV